MSYFLSVRAASFFAAWGLGVLAGGAAYADAVPSADRPVGEVTMSVGPVARTSAQGLPEVVRRGSPIMPGDRLDTADGGHVHIKFIDGALVSIRPGSRLWVQDYRYDPEHVALSAGSLQIGIRCGTRHFGRRRGRCQGAVPPEHAASRHRRARHGFRGAQWRTRHHRGREPGRDHHGALRGRVPGAGPGPLWLIVSPYPVGRNGPAGGGIPRAIRPTGNQAASRRGVRRHFRGGEQCSRQHAIRPGSGSGGRDREVGA